MARKINLVTGGAGFIGSNLIDYLLKKGEEIICLDNFSSGSIKNLSEFKSFSNFKILNQDVREFIDIDYVDNIYHLASIAAPSNYLNNPIETASINFQGTLNILQLANRCKSKLLFASTSEVYGQFISDPISEDSLGVLNTDSIRSCYFESKRAAESLCFDFSRKYDLQIKVVRIFNTYGPMMSLSDGRVISSFIKMGLNKESFTIFGDGEQTRSFCYISDLLNGLSKLMNSTFKGPINLGNPNQITIKELAYKISNKLNLDINFEYKPQLADEPRFRKPSILLAKEVLNWEPIISIDQGLDLMINYYINY